MKRSKKFTDEELARIRTAVREAEGKVSGEIVPFITARSGDYAIANYKASLIAGTLIFAIIAVLDRYALKDATHTLFYDPVFIFFVVVAGAGLGALLPSLWPGLKRWLIPRDYQDDCCRQRAENAFLEEEIFNTRHRTGILIFVSFFEHEVIVMADKGISKMVEQQEWNHIVETLVSRIRAGRVIEGIEEGVRMCGELLVAKGFQKEDDDINELGDDLRIN